MTADTPVLDTLADITVASVKQAQAGRLWTRWTTLRTAPGLHARTECL